MPRPDGGTVRVMWKIAPLVLPLWMVAAQTDEAPAEGAAAAEAAPPVTDSRGLAPAEIPPTSLRYEMNAALAPKTRKILGKETITWTVPGATPVRKVPLHLYLNAFSNEASTWMRGATALRNFDAEKYIEPFGDPWGYVVIQKIEQLVRTEKAVEPPAAAAADDDDKDPPKKKRKKRRRKRARDPADTADAAPPAAPPAPEVVVEEKWVDVTYSFIAPNDGNVHDRTLAEVALAAPVPPGKELVLRVKFLSRLPVPIARTGGGLGYFHVAQWFPKLGMYEVKGVRGARADGFNVRQFHGPTEFYAEYADWKVAIQTPEAFTVVATGERTDKPTPTKDGYVEVTYQQRGVHDFAWVAAEDIVVDEKVHQPAGGGPPIKLSMVVPKGLEWMLPTMRKASETTFDVLGKRVGPYPYSTMKVICPPMKAAESGGMEYPTLVTGLTADELYAQWPFANVHLNEQVIAHEVTHNYFYGLVGSNEQEEAFLDEGFTNYWEAEIADVILANTVSEVAGFPVLGNDLDKMGYKSNAPKMHESVVRKPANMFFPGTHGTQIYNRPTLILRTMNNRFGRGETDKLFSAYFARWRFRHPAQEDFLAVAQETLTPNAYAFLREQMFARTIPDYAVDKVSVDKVEPRRGIYLPPGPLTGDPVPSAEVTAEGEALAHAAFRLDDAQRTDDRFSAVGMPPLADEQAGLAIKIYDPGFVVDGTPPETVFGTVQTVVAEAETVPAEAADEDEEEDVYRTSVRLTGPGFAHLPVDVAFEFDDGKKVTQRWDGRAAWREFVFWRKAKLKQVWIDPSDELLVDADPTNNGRIEEPDSPAATEASGVVAAFVSWLVMGVAWWL